jgi:type IV pilus assembly protein PilF
VARVLKAFYFLFITLCICLQACVHNGANENTALKKTNLSKAASYNVQLGLGYLKQGDRPRAKKKLLTALEQEPKSPDVNSAIAYYFEQTSEPEQAEKYYLKAMSLAAHAGAQLNNYGTFLCRKGDYKKAEYYFLKAVNDLQYLHTAGAYENAGLCALLAAEEGKAKLYFLKALNQDPARKMSFYELVKLEIKEGHNAKAFALVQKYPDLVLGDKVLLSLARDISEKVGQQQVAKEYARTMKQRDSNLINGGEHNEYNNHA